MKIYRIYKWIQDYQWSPYSDDYMPIDNQETVKYVDSLEKVEEFLQNIEEYNRTCLKCIKCPLIQLSKRQYNNGKHNDDIDTYCDKKDIQFVGNNVLCKNEMKANFNNYDYEEIEVE